jgi:hypothetical protein
MTVRKSFLLRLDPATFDALQAWAADDLRSVNGQVEFLLRRSLRDAGRFRGGSSPEVDHRGQADETPSRVAPRGVAPGTNSGG